MQFALGLLALVFVVEHVLRINRLPRLYTLLEWTAAQLGWGFHLCGQLFARVSAFLDWIQLHELSQTFADLVLGCWSVVKTPFQFVLGYAEAAFEYLHPNLVLAGSALLLCVGLYLLVHYGDRLPWMRWLKSQQLWLVAETGWGWSGLTVLQGAEARRWIEGQAPGQPRRNGPRRRPLE